MFPGMTAVPPLPPDIQAQQQPMMSQFAEMRGAGMGMGAGIPDPVALLEAKVAELESWAESTAPLLSQINPAAAALLVPIAQAGKALQSEVASMRERQAGPSPQVAG